MLKFLIALVVVMTLSQTASAQLLRRRAATSCADGICSVPAAAVVKEASKKVEAKAAPVAAACSTVTHRVTVRERVRERGPILRRCS